MIPKKLIPKHVRIDAIESTGLLQVTDGDNWTKEKQFLPLRR
jgi:hypothetical protein